MSTPFEDAYQRASKPEPVAPTMEVFAERAYKLLCESYFSPSANAGGSIVGAQAYATMALYEAQREANEIAREALDLAKHQAETSGLYR